MKNVQKKIAAIILSIIIIITAIMPTAAYADGIELDLANGAITIDGTNYKQGTTEVAYEGKPITITGNYTITTAAAVTVTAGSPNIILREVKIDAGAPSHPGATGGSGISVSGDGTNPTITIEGTTNTITGGKLCAAIEGKDKASATININGKLVVNGGDSAAAIGTGWIKNKGATMITAEMKSLTINVAEGRSLIAKGGASGAGIGTGYGRIKNEINENKIEEINIICDGTIEATSKSSGAGIGTGSLEAKADDATTNTIGKLNISGKGTIISTGGKNGAGIGTGFVNTKEKAINTIGVLEISGVTIKATGGAMHSTEFQGPAGIGTGAKLEPTQVGVVSDVGKLTIAKGTKIEAYSQTAAINVALSDTNKETILMGTFGKYNKSFKLFNTKEAEIPNADNVNLPNEYKSFAVTTTPGVNKIKVGDKTFKGKAVVDNAKFVIKFDTENGKLKKYIDLQEAQVIKIKASNGELVSALDNEILFEASKTWADVKAEAAGMVKAEDGYKIIKWMVGNKVVEDGDALKVNTTYTAIFKKTITIEAGENGKLKDGAENEYEFVGDKTWADTKKGAENRVEANTGYYLEKWTKDGQEVKDGDALVADATYTAIFKAVDKDELKKAIKAADEIIKTDKYKNAKEGNKKALDIALAEAKVVYDNNDATQKEVDDATKKLNEAINALDGKTVDKTALKKAIDDADEAKETDKYKKADPEKKKALDDALDEANKVNDNPNATQEEVDDATKKLNDATGELDGKTPIIPITPSETSLVITKVDRETGEKLEGALFELRDIDGLPAGRATSGYNGIATITVPAAGTYELVEIRAPYGYYNTMNRTVEIGEGQTKITVENIKRPYEPYDPTPWRNIEETVRPEPKPEPVIVKPVVEKLYARANYINGYPDGTFKPEGRITRTETAQMLANILLSSGFDAGYYAEEFKDIKGDNWYNSAVATVTKHKVFKGYDDGSFNPNGHITRAEFVATAVRLLNEGTAVGNSKGLRAGHWAIKEVEKAYQLGWLYEYDNKAFNEDVAITREEVVQILNKALRLTADKDYINLNQSSMTNFTDVPMTHKNFYEIMTAANTVASVDESGGTWMNIGPINETNTKAGNLLRHRR